MCSPVLGLSRRVDLNVFDTALEKEFREKIAQHMMDWETFKGEANLYDEAAMFVPGCLFETMPAG